MMKIRKYALLTVSAVIGIGFAGSLMAVDFPGFSGFNSNGGATTTANDVSILTCKNIGQSSPTTDTGSSSCESTSNGSSSCSSSTNGANINEVTLWESTKEIDPALLNGTCVEAMQALGNCSIKGAYGNGVIVIQCN